MRKVLVLLAVIAVAGGLCMGCKAKTTTETGGETTVDVSTEGVSVQSDEGSVDVSAEGVAVEGEGAEVTVGAEGVSVDVPGDENAPADDGETAPETTEETTEGGE